MPTPPAPQPIERRVAALRRWFHGRVFSIFVAELPAGSVPAGKQIAHDARRAGLNLERNSHTGQKLDGLAFDLHLHLCALEYDARGADPFVRGWSVRPAAKFPVMAICEAISCRLGASS